MPIKKLLNDTANSTLKNVSVVGYKMIISSFLTVYECCLLKLTQTSG